MDQVQKVFLNEKNELAIKRVVKGLNEKGKEYPNRGLILMGPPGTGKTLSGRIMMNQLKEDITFIWVSAKDFYNYGTSRGLIEAFENSKLLAPTALLFEDADNWINGGMALDLIKSEMDGIAQSKGLVTMIATNYPERMPDALIDRPGRFHDILEFDLPEKSVRYRMLKAWLNDELNFEKTEDNQVLEKFAEETEGFSGAHIYEFVQFSKLLKEEDESAIDTAMSKALDKIKEQRQLLGDNQVAGATYRGKSLEDEEIDGPIPFKTAAEKMLLLLENDQEYNENIRKMVYNQLCKSYEKEGKKAPSYRTGSVKQIDEIDDNKNPLEMLSEDQKKALIIEAATQLAIKLVDEGEE